ncbi:hypothetical protein [Paraburkholderia bannensis]|uniref:hypothetical protein n=1 Tax=Paraburkholderia bannensis TaxID=765414 RepID=UPI002ABD41DA|nr:hypothetical protein [Paraburkholderia bannensis]
MALKKTLAGVAPFASLLSKARGAKAEENERDQREGESDDDYAKRMEELDDKEKAEQEERDKEAARARGEGNDVDGDDADADGDDETDDAKKAARASERTRCARIIAHGIAIGQVEQASALAFNTTMSSAAAALVLDAGKMAVASGAAPRASRPSLDERMAHARPANPGNGAPAAPAPTMAEQILMAGKIRRGEA